MKNMPAIGPTQMDYVAWASRVNARWIVHRDLNRNAEAYLAHLAQVDQRRLATSCRNAHWMVAQAASEDPKPWFYAGLFNLATVEETARHLATHWLTNIVIDVSKQAAVTGAESVSEATVEKIHRIQAALAKLPGEPPSRENPLH